MEAHPTATTLARLSGVALPRIRALHAMHAQTKFQSSILEVFDQQREACTQAPARLPCMHRIRLPVIAASLPAFNRYVLLVQVPEALKLSQGNFSTSTRSHNYDYYYRSYVIDR